VRTLPSPAPWEPNPTAAVPRQRPRDQRQRSGPRGGGGRASPRGGGIGGMAHDGTTSGETSRPGGPAATADGARDRNDAPEAGHATAATAAANILLRSSIGASFQTSVARKPILGLGWMLAVGCTTPAGGLRAPAANSFGWDWLAWAPRTPEGPPETSREATGERNYPIGGGTTLLGSIRSRSYCPARSGTGWGGATPRLSVILSWSAIMPAPRFSATAAPTLVRPSE
jgi:hypothetical protein